MSIVNSRLPILVALMTLAGCGSQGNLLSLTGVVEPYRSARIHLSLDERPIAAAHIRAIPIDTSAMALPAKPEIIEQALYAYGHSAITDETGHATLKLFNYKPHLIEVSPSPFDELAAQGPWTWIIEADATTLATADRAEPASARPLLQIDEP